MASFDVRDVLNIPDASGPRLKKQKVSAPRQNLKGLAREVQSLGGDNPIAIVPEVTSFKKRRFGSRKPAAKWEMRSFQNSARGDQDTMVLRHWRRKNDPDAPHSEDQMDDVQGQEDAHDAGGEVKKEVLEDSSFAKFNVKVPVPQYSDDQYNTNLRNDDWTKEETDYLLETVKAFDLRWPLIWDRYDFMPKAPEGPDGGESKVVAVIPAPKPRTMEDLKARYYEVAAKMMAVQKPAQYMTRPEFELYETMMNFNPHTETARKQFVANTLARSKDEAREEESLLIELKRILARNERFNEERRDLYHRLDYPHTDQDISTFKSSAGLHNLLQNLMNADKSKKRKSLAAGPDGTGATPTSASQPGLPGPNPPSDGPGNRRESIAASAHGHSSHREPVASATPVTPAEPTPNTATGDKKKKGGATAVERRKLSEQEELVYGVSYHDRLGGGPTFRYEKINKLYSHKSGQQQKRITNLLTELDVPPRLAMPTAAVTAQFELLWGALTTLVDLRKVSEKLDNEIQLEEAKKLERDRAKGIVPAEDKADADGKTVPDSQESAQEQQPQGEGGEAAPSVVIKNEDGDQVQAEEDGNKEKRPGSSGAHKRSASVLSAASDKSAKRQKK